MTDLNDRLVHEWGSPAYVYELDDVKAAHVDLTAALPQGSTLLYSLKANPHPALVRVLRELGCHAEVSSEGELAIALRAGFTPTSVLYTGPGKTAGEISVALQHGVRKFSVESTTELRRLGALAAGRDIRAEVILRVNGRSAGSTGLRMTGTASQFGIDEGQVLADVSSIVSVPGTEIIGLHFYPLSGAKDEEALLESLGSSIEVARQLADAGIPLRFLDLGGGFATPYAQPGLRPSYPRLRSALSAVLDQHIPGWRDGLVDIAFESGRHLVGGCGRLLTTVLNIKQSGDRTFVVLDAGINHLSGMFGIGRLTRPSAVPVQSHDGKGSFLATIVGPLCTPADVLGREASIERVAEGDVLEFANVGAYGLTASLIGFLGRPSPVEIVLQEGAVVSATHLHISRHPLSLVKEDRHV